MTPSVTNARAMVTVANAILIKAGFDPNQQRGPGGEWTAEGGGGRHSGHSGGPTTGAETRTYPFAPSRKELEMEEKHNELARIHREMVRGGTESRDPDLMEVETELHNSAQALRAKKATRQADLAAARAREAQSAQRPFAAHPAAAEQQARTDRRTEAERLQAAHAQRNRERQTFYSSSHRDDNILNEINNLGSVASAATAAASVAATAAGGSAGTLRAALASTTARMYRSIRHVQNIVGHSHGIAATTDYARIGEHLTHIKDNISSLQRELKGMPADVRGLRTQTNRKLKQAKVAAEKLQDKVREQIKRMKRSRSGT